MEIPLTQDKVAHIDPEDWPLVAASKWYARHDQDGRWYAKTNAWSREKGKRSTPQCTA